MNLCLFAATEAKPSYEGLNGVNRQPSNGPKINRQPSKTGYFYRQPSNERAKISRQISQISLNDRDRLTWDLGVGLQYGTDRDARRKF